MEPRFGIWCMVGNAAAVSTSHDVNLPQIATNRHSLCFVEGSLFLERRGRRD